MDIVIAAAVLATLCLIYAVATGGAALNRALTQGLSDVDTAREQQGGGCDG